MCVCCGCLTMQRGRDCKVVHVGPASRVAVLGIAAQSCLFRMLRVCMPMLWQPAQSVAGQDLLGQCRLTIPPLTKQPGLRSNLVPRADACEQDAGVPGPPLSLQLGCQGAQALRRRHGSGVIHGVVAFEGYDPSGALPLLPQSVHLTRYMPGHAIPDSRIVS